MVRNLHTYQSFPPSLPDIIVVGLDHKKQFHERKFTYSDYSGELHAWTFSRFKNYITTLYITTPSVLCNLHWLPMPYQIQLLVVFVVIGCHEIFFFVLGFLNNKTPADEITRLFFYTSESFFWTVVYVGIFAAFTLELWCKQGKRLS